MSCEGPVSFIKCRLITIILMCDDIRLILHAKLSLKKFREDIGQIFFG